MLFTILLSSILLFFSISVKKISKSYSDFLEMSLLIKNINNTNDLTIINDTLYFGQSIIKEFDENKIDTNCKKIFFENNTPNKRELNNFLLFFITSIEEFSVTFYKYSSIENTTKLSFILSYSEDIIITFETIKVNNSTLIKDITGVGRFMKKICPILIK